MLLLLFTPCLPAPFASIGHFVVNAELFCPRKWGLVGKDGDWWGTHLLLSRWVKVEVGRSSKLVVVTRDGFVT